MAASPAGSVVSAGLDDSPTGKRWCSARVGATRWDRGRRWGLSLGWLGPHWGYAPRCLEVFIMVLLWDTWGPRHGPPPRCLGSPIVDFLQDAQIPSWPSPGCLQFPLWSFSRLLGDSHHGPAPRHPASPSWFFSGIFGVPIMVLLQDTQGPHCYPSPLWLGSLSRSFGMPGVPTVVLLHDTWVSPRGPSPGCRESSAITLLQGAEGPHCGPSLGQDACSPQLQPSP